MCEAMCSPRCVCATGYIRNDKGDCVKPETCPMKCTKANEVYSRCDNNSCQKSCATLDKYVACRPICTPGCVCATGYIRDYNGDCIKEKDCPTKCKVNEEYSLCGANGCQNTCAKPTFSQVCEGPCTPGCICKQGYLRDDNGNCVLRNKCPPVCKADEVYSVCGTACPLTCDNMDNPPPCIKKCVAGCFCKPDLVLDANKKCILASSCPWKCKKPNEVYSTCGTSCPVTCENKENPPMCEGSCSRGCVCATGYIRNDKGDCVKPETCPMKCTKANEVYSLCDNNSCQKSCATLGKYVACRPICTPGCVCATGYIRNDNGDCIRPQDCPAEICSFPEEYSRCGANKCQNTCADPYLSTSCKGACTPGCICKQGYRREKGGHCVECYRTCRKNEEYTTCGTACPKTCDKIGIRSNCSRECVAGCFCRPFFFLNNNGDCVRLENCEGKCMKPNTVFDTMGTDCPVTCENKENPPVCKSRLSPRCVCATGYVKNDKGDCVKPENCPMKCTKRYEVYSECGANNCQNTCAKPTFSHVCEGPCTPGCVCKKGYLRAANGSCIAAKSCPVEATVPIEPTAAPHQEVIPIDF
jgi:hypothetical protein